MKEQVNAVTVASNQRDYIEIYDTDSWDRYRRELHEAGLVQMFTDLLNNSGVRKLRLYMPGGPYARMVGVVVLQGRAPIQNYVTVGKWLERVSDFTWRMDIDDHVGLAFYVGKVGK